MPAVEGAAALPQQSLHDSRLVYAVEDERLRAIPVTTHGTRRNCRGGLDVLVSSQALRDGAEVLISDMPQARQGLLVNATRPQPARSDRSVQLIQLYGGPTGVRHNAAQGCVLAMRA